MKRTMSDNVNAEYVEERKSKALQECVKKHKPRRESAEGRTGVNVSIKMTKRGLELQRDALLIKQKRPAVNSKTKKRKKKSNGKEGRE